MWYNAANIPLFDTAPQITGFVCMMPTQTADVYVLQLKPLETWTVFSFSYIGVIVFLRHRKVGQLVEVNIYMEADDESAYSEEDKEFSDNRCSLWLGEPAEVQDYNRRPDLSEVYSIFKDYNTTISASGLADPHFAIYNGFAC